jgi:hypothetical protein
MNTKDIGNLGEHIAIVELLKNDIEVSRPLGDNSRYDLILDINTNLFTCQVKSTSSSTDKLAEFPLTSSQAHRGGSRHKYDVDLFCCVDIPKNKVFIVPNIDSKGSIKIRYEPTENGQSKGINMWYDFTILKFLETL